MLTGSEPMSLLVKFRIVFESILNGPKYYGFRNDLTVSLSNYLHGKKVNITNADLNNDGVIDSLDMCRLRKLVLSYNK